MLINVCLLLLQETGGYQVPYRVLIGELERAACFVLFVSGFASGEVRRYPPNQEGIINSSSCCVNTIACEVSVGFDCKTLDNR